MKILMMMVVSGVALIISGAAVAGDHPEHYAKTAPKAREASITPQTTCPVMGGDINKDLYVDHDGKRVYVCCKECIAVVTKDPQKYIKKLEDDGVTVTKLQTTCPVMGGDIDKQFYTDHDGQRVYFCCQACIKMFEASPDQYLKKLKAVGVTLDPVPKAAEVKDAHGIHDAHEGHHH